MSSDNAAMEAALLEIAKDLLQASDDLASTDPSASAKLAHEAYEIGRDLGIVRNHLDDAAGLSSALNERPVARKLRHSRPSRSPVKSPDISIARATTTPTPICCAFSIGKKRCCQSR